MTFDFTKEYERLSNEELLKIVHQADQYQPEAVAAAQEILDKRNVTEEEENKVDKHFYNKEAEKNAVAQTKQAAKNIINEKLEYLINPIKNQNEKFSPLHWLSYLVIIEAIYYLTSIPNTISSIVFFFKDYNIADAYDGLIAITILLGLCYFPLKLYLFLKRKKWGWILFIFGALYGIASYLQSIIIKLFFNPFFGQDLGNVSILTIANLTLEILLFYFLLKPEISSFFNVNKHTKTLAIALSAVICIIIFLPNLLQA